TGFHIGPWRGVIRLLLLVFNLQPIGAVNYIYPELAFLRTNSAFILPSRPRQRPLPVIAFSWDEWGAHEKGNQTLYESPRWIREGNDAGNQYGRARHV